MENSLEKLRDKIDGIDRQIVDLLVDRKNVVERVMILKNKHGMAVYHPAREENLISARRNQGEKAGLSPEYVEEIFRSILHRSRIEQLAKMTTKEILPGANVLILGGTGEMGVLFDSWFSNSGYNVRILGRKNWHKAEEFCSDISLALVSVPIDNTVDMIGKIAPFLPTGCILADITSIKKVPLSAMLDAYNGPVVGLHPLFGPSTSSIEKQVVVATPGRGEEECRWLMEQFSAWGAVVVKASAEEHDEIMAIVQALRHFATFAFGKFLWQRGVDISRTLEFSSPIYRLELGMVGRLFKQNPALYSEIIFATPERRKLLKEFVDAMNENISMLENADKEKFNTDFEKISQWFGPFSDQALRESSFLIEKLIERF